MYKHLSLYLSIHPEVDLVEAWPKATSQWLTDISTSPAQLKLMMHSLNLPCHINTTPS